MSRYTAENITEMLERAYRGFVTQVENTIAEIQQHEYATNFTLSSLVKAQENVQLLSFVQNVPKEEIVEALRAQVDNANYDLLNNVNPGTSSCGFSRAIDAVKREVLQTFYQKWVVILSLHDKHQ